MKTNVEVKAPKGRLQLRLSAPAPVYVTAYGCEALAGFAAVFDLDLSSEVTFRVDAPSDVRAYRFQPERTSVQSEGRSFTNIDREPQESHAVSEVTKALRMFKLEQRASLRELRAERAALVRAREAQVIETTEKKENVDENEAKKTDGAAPDAAPAPASSPAPAPDADPVKKK